MKAEDYKQTADPEDAFGGRAGVAALHCAIWEQVLAKDPESVVRHVTTAGGLIPGHSGTVKDGETIIEAHRRLHEELLP